MKNTSYVSLFLLITNQENAKTRETSEQQKNKDQLKYHECKILTKWIYCFRLWMVFSVSLYCVFIYKLWTAFDSIVTVMVQFCLALKKLLQISDNSWHVMIISYWKFEFTFKAT